MFIATVVPNCYIYCYCYCHSKWPYLMFMLLSFKVVRSFATSNVIRSDKNYCYCYSLTWWPGLLLLLVSYKVVKFTAPATVIPAGQVYLILIQLYQVLLQLSYLVGQVYGYCYSHTDQVYWYCYCHAWWPGLMLLLLSFQVATLSYKTQKIWDNMTGLVSFFTQRGV